MITGSSSLIHRVAAVTLLALCAWGVAVMGVSILSERGRLLEQLQDARDSYARLTQRSVDPKSLKEKINEILNSQELHAQVALVDSGEAALSTLQSRIRGAIDSAGGNVRSVSEARRSNKTTIAVDVSFVVPERALEAVLASAEDGEPEIQFESMSIKRSDTPIDPQNPELMITASAKLRWLRPAGYIQ